VTSLTNLIRKPLSWHVLLGLLIGTSMTRATGHNGQSIREPTLPRTPEISMMELLCGLAQPAGVGVIAERPSAVSSIGMVRPNGAEQLYDRRRWRNGGAA
jgi:hypothetical protein